MIHKAAGVLLLLVMAASLRIAADGMNAQTEWRPLPVERQIDQLIGARQYKRAIDLSLLTAADMKKSEDWKGYITFMLRAADIETFEVWKGKGFPDADLVPDYRRPLKYLQMLNKHAGPFLDQYPGLKANTLFTTAVVYYWLDMPDTAEILHHQALQLRKNVYGETSREVADSYLWRGVLYMFGRYRKDLAEQNYRAALELQKQFLPDSRYALGSVYYGLANIAMEDFQFDEALVLADQYQSLYDDLPYEQAFGIQLVANVYWNKGDYEQALASRTRTINLYEKSKFQEDLIIEYSNLSTDLLNLGRYPEAEKALQKGAQILRASHIQDPYYAKMLYATFGTLYTSMKKYDAAWLYLQKALDIAVNHYGERNDAVADIYSLRGVMSKDQKLFEEALDDYQHMLTAVIPGFSAAGYRVIPEVQYENPSFKNIIAATFNKADALLAWFANDGDTAHLQLALENYRHAYRQISVARDAIGDELSKPFLLSNFAASIENSIAAAHMLYKKTHDSQYIQEMLYFVEFTKYLNVLDALQRADRANNSEVPLEILLRLQGVRSEINKLQKTELDHQRLQLSTDSVSKIRNQIVDLIQERKQLMSSITSRSRHASYEHGLMMMSMRDIRRQLKNDEQILEFYWGKDSIYTISVTNQSTHVRAIAHIAALDSLLSNVQDMLEGEPSYDPKDVRHYSRNTTALYGKLFRPVVEKRKLIIIPDGPLNLVPVEALVVRHREDEHSYRDLDYAVQHFEISYAYSSSILFHKTKNHRTKIEKVLAFGYSDDGERSTAGTQDSLASLPGTFSEIETLSAVFKNVSRFTAGDALKANFIKHAGDHDLIHLGVHGIGDPNTADHSRLVFRPDSLDTEDLYAYEIYNLNIGASLAVLSACETGLGKHQAGEGIFSIARAFTYAGCPSVVMSLWRAHDAHTASIMRGFYQSLQHGHSVSASLRQSKQRFLDAADEFSSHPSNWSAFVLNGKDQTFQNTSSSFALWLIATILVLVAYLSLRKSVSSNQ
ncbi:MAG: CHAT domain-containing protein [Chryseosolibacter sp.]